MKRIKDIDQEIEQLKQEKANLVKYLPEMIEQRIADALHYATCHHNHTDQCGYEYESWGQPGNEKKDQLTKAKALLQYIERLAGQRDDVEEIAEKLISLITD